MNELENLNELDNFYEFKQYIKMSILENENLFRLIYFCYKNPFDENTCSYPENPFEIFNNNDNNHGTVLFKQKNDMILNYEMPTILVNFSTESSQNNKSISYTKIEFSIICKGVNIQDLDNGKSRSYSIAKLIDKFMNHSDVIGTDKVKRLYFNNNILNEENCGYEICYQTTTTSYSDQVEIYTHSTNEDTWGITREIYSHVIKDIPVLVGIEPSTETKEVRQHGYDLDITRTMFCDKIPEIIESTVIKYNDKFYRIQKVVEYEDYLECLLVVTYTIKIID